MDVNDYINNDIIFDAKASAVPYNYRISYKIAYQRCQKTCIGIFAWFRHLKQRKKTCIFEIAGERDNSALEPVNKRNIGAMQQRRLSYTRPATEALYSRK